MVVRVYPATKLFSCFGRPNLTNTAPERAARATAPTSGASGPVAAVLAGARRRNRVDTYDETSHRTGPRKPKIPHIADARTATGRLTEEIKIGPQLIGMIEKSASLARTAEAGARQRRQRYDDGLTVDKTPPPTPPPTPHLIACHNPAR